MPFYLCIRMPLYEYSCPKCGDFEVLQRVSTPPLKKHDCGRTVHRKVSLSSFQLKGGGWYKDLYGSAKATPAPGASSPAPPAKGA
jgi:putative FmdB family regulatory protein